MGKASYSSEATSIRKSEPGGYAIPKTQEPGILGHHSHNRSKQSTTFRFISHDHIKMHCISHEAQMSTRIKLKQKYTSILNCISFGIHSVNAFRQTK